MTSGSQSSGPHPNPLPGGEGAIARRLLHAGRYIWASPTTALGLIVTLLTLLTGGRSSIVAGVIETHGGFATWLLRKLVPLPGGASAMTLGHVVIGRNATTLRETRAHERVHVRQCERWGPFFVPAYLGVSLWLMARGRDGYRDNPFEREAYDEAP